MTNTIDIDKCELTLENPLMVINSNTKLSDLKKMKNYRYFTSSTKKNHSCTLGVVSIGGHDCSPRFYFEYELLTFFQFGICPQGGWEGWSEENQIKVKECNGEWLLKVTGKPPPYKSKNGIIESIYDERSGGSYICFAYPQNHGKKG